MKKLSLTNRFLFFVNQLLAVATLAGYTLPFLDPVTAKSLSVFSLTMPLLLTANAGFVLYWSFQLKKHLLVSLALLGLGYSHVQSFVQISAKEVFLNNDLKVMSYNARMFNKSKWSKIDRLEQKACQWIQRKNPDVLGIQEYHQSGKNLLAFPYNYIKENPNGYRTSQAFFSKHKIIHKGSLNFKKSGNNAIFVDIVCRGDTLRFYNIHLQSLNIDKNKENFGQKNSEKLLERFEKTFSEQALQVAKILEHQKNSPHRTIFLGDFNNTAFSWTYRQLKKDKKDAFVEAGAGIGKTFDYVLPFRIDFILTDKTMETNHFKTLRVPYSDHYPILARIQTQKPTPTNAQTAKWKKKD